MADERINTPIALREMERRWTAIRAAMAEARIDVLLAQANNDFMGGYVKYLTDVPATNGYWATVIFPREERMTVIGQGPFGLDRSFPEEGDPLRRGVARFLGSPSFASASYTAAYDATLAEKALERYAGATIGLLGAAAISHAFVEHLRRGRLSAARFVDASELVDRIKAEKSDDELALIRRTAAMQDAAMDAVFKTIRPGMRDLEVAAIAEQAGHAHGSEQGLFLCASGPVDSAPVFGNRHVQNRVIRTGDQFTLLIENSGPGGYYTELGRTCVLGKASQEMKDEYEIVLEAQRFTLGLIRPGASCKEIYEAYNAFLRERGRPEERRVHSHGMGYDMVERPLVRHDETMPIRLRLNFSLHPTWTTARTYSWICDNFWLDERGTIERLHRFPQRIFEL